MKSALVPLFLFFAFPLAFAQQVLDSNGNPIFPGREYYILPAIFGPPGGGVKLATTGNSKCPVTVLQDYSEVVNGISVKFTIPGVSTLEIYEGTPLEIEFTKKPKCADSSKWIIFVDNEIAKACVGIGGPEDHPGQQTFPGTFSIKKYKFGYKLVFCVAGSPTCLDIGRFDNGEGGRRLNLTEGEAFDIVFVESSSYNNVIRSVV
ncbi:kunitz-type trypsin inhibitor-like 2 protein [Arachis duranensis]|uniref:Kunitz-type trypsin inhibitor-like 2 protein n=1 Tax=Arachis duranensis TaxID=130453 RepID=A0A6P4DCN0_ARADU|nr:kunitz-type trypsin inhibitor-like 2 protein [Arachis duranensis]XP_057758769.1 kunitz-type trypsin inhibitor-like 2 protein [Arachis stenosperma]